jgi:hypothetical protein
VRGAHGRAYGAKCLDHGLAVCLGVWWLFLLEAGDTSIPLKITSMPLLLSPNGASSLHRSHRRTVRLQQSTLRTMHHRCIGICAFRRQHQTDFILKFFQTEACEWQVCCCHSLASPLSRRWPEQARDSDFTESDLSRLAQRGRIERTARGVYRIPYNPINRFSQYREAVLWAQAHRGPQMVELSHETALAVYGISNANPAAIHLTLPKSARLRRE